MREAGGSRWAPWAALLATRLLSGLTCITLAFLLTLGFIWVSSPAAYVTLWFSGITYFGLARCSYLQGQGERASRKSAFSTAFVFLHSITAALSVFDISEFVLLAIGWFNPNSLIILTPRLAYLLDVLVMQACIRLRYRYSLFFLVLSTLFTIIMFLISDVRCWSCLDLARIGAFVGFNIGIGFVASLIAVFLTRISWPCFKN